MESIKYISLDLRIFFLSALLEKIAETLNINFKNPVTLKNLKIYCIVNQLNVVNYHFYLFLFWSARYEVNFFDHSWH